MLFVSECRASQVQQLKLQGGWAAPWNLVVRLARWPARGERVSATGIRAGLVWLQDFVFFQVRCSGCFRRNTLYFVQLIIYAELQCGICFHFPVLCHLFSKRSFANKCPAGLLKDVAQTPLSPGLLDRGRIFIGVYSTAYGMRWKKVLTALWAARRIWFRLCCSLALTKPSGTSAPAEGPGKSERCCPVSCIAKSVLCWGETEQDSLTK